MVKKNTYTLLISLCAFFISDAALAQDSIVLANGKGISGLIKNKGWVKTPDQILFERDGEKFKYSPLELSEFYVNGDKYISKGVKINITNQSLQGLAKGYQQEIVSKTIFLKVLVEGNSSLYSHRLVRTHFFASKAKTFLELTNLKTRSGGNAVRYIGQLRVLWNNCDQDLNIEKIRFATSSLIKAFERYNSCSGNGSDYVVKKNPLRKSLFALAGYKLIDYDLSANSFYSNFMLNGSDTGRFNFGVGFELGILNNSDRFQIYNDLLFQQYKYEGSYRDATSDDQFIDYDLAVDVAYLELANLARYNFGDDFENLTFFLNGGLAHAFLVSDRSSEKSNSVFFGTETMRDRRPLGGQIKSYTLSGIIGLGLRINQFLLEARYRFKPEAASFPKLSNAESINFLLSYKIL